MRIKTVIRFLVIGCLFSGISIGADNLQLAFPTAEGFGRYTSGGRGGQVIEVTNLSDQGPGSLRAAVETDTPRTIVFRVSGTIILQSPLEINYGNVTIAGQTAPGDGICLRDYSLWIKADNVIIRYLRSRLGDVHKLSEDAISCIRQKNIIVDHCSFSWGIDEVASFWDNKNSTVQWCIISESLHHSYHHKGDHGYGGIWGGEGGSFHHNLLADNASRNPRFNGSRYNKEPEKEIVDFRNNVIYNWGFNSGYGGEAGQQNLIANYYKYGPGSKHKNRIAEPWDATGKWFIQDNFVYGYPEITKNNWAGGVQGKFAKKVRINQPIPVVPIITHSAQQAYELVLADAGATLPARDPVDQRVIKGVRTGKATYGGKWGAHSGIIDSQNQVGGWPELHSAPAPKDSDHDGMPDDWEIKHGLDPFNKKDGNSDWDQDGYTNLEQYLNELTLRTDFINAPAELTAEAISSNQIRLSWKENIPDEQGFAIERRDQENGTFQEISRTSADSTAFTDSRLSSKTMYTYRVRAFRDQIFSIYTEDVSVKSLSQAP
jgi:hypothetical protein